MFVPELVVLSSVNYSLTLLEGLLFYSYPRGAFALEWLVRCTRTFMLKKSTALEWLALCLVHRVLGVDSTLTYRFFCRLVDVHHWQHDFHHYFDFFVRKPRTISALLWTWSKKEVICWLCLFCITTGCDRNS